MLGLSTFRLYAYGAIVVLAGLAYWRYSYVSDARDEAEAKLTAVTADLKSEQVNRKKADEASNRYQGRIRDLEDQRTADGFGVISVCRRPTVKLQPANASASPDAGPVRSDPPPVEVSVDVGPAADLYGTRCEANRIQLEELQRWIREQKR